VLLRFHETLAEDAFETSIRLATQSAEVQHYINALRSCTLNTPSPFFCLDILCRPADTGVVNEWDGRPFILDTTVRELTSKELIDRFAQT